MFDRGKGYIKMERLRDALKTVGFNPTDCFLEQKIINADGDRNNRLDFEEFLELVKMLVTEEQEIKEGLSLYSFLSSKAD
jgi:Ca2+-binding protein (EF-Hand superfamily)